MTRRGFSLLAACAVLVLLSPAAEASEAELDSAGTVARAHSYHAPLKINDAARLWADFNETMRGGFGSVEKLEEVLKQISDQVGLLRGCLREGASLEGQYWVYRGDCTFSKSQVPLTLVLAFDSAGKIAGLWIRPEAKPHPTQFLDYETTTELELPFPGEWKVFWGGRELELNYHAVARDQRFAYDFVIERESKTHAGEGSLNGDYYCFGVPVVAPAAGTVVMVTDRVADNRPGRMNAGQPLGNAIILDHGGGEFSVLAHFQRGSVRVELGQSVAAGDTLARCGNSGNSSEPHLHYHLQNGAEPFAADGLPAPFYRFRANGKPVARGEPVRGQVVSRD